MAQDWTSNENAKSKVCFVTTGATAPFTALIESVLQPSALDALCSGGYTHLLVQYGTAKDIFSDRYKAACAYLQQKHPESKLFIDGIGFLSNGLTEQFKLVRQTHGLVISHAGSGSILEALRFQVPVVVVPNTALLDNHQEELATTMEKSNYLLRGDVKHLAPAIEKSENFRVKMSQFPPVTSGKHRETKTFAAIMDETMGILE